MGSLDNIRKSGVLVRKPVPESEKALDEELDEVAEDVEYLCDGSENH